MQTAVGKTVSRECKTARTVKLSTHLSPSLPHALFFFFSCPLHTHAHRAVYNMWYSFVSVLTDIETDKAPPSGASAKPGPADVFPAPSPSSSESTLALSDRSSSFGSDYSSSPTNGGGGGSAFAAGGFRANRTVAATGGGRGGGSGEKAAVDHHQAAERRIACGGCPRLASLVDLSYGVPMGPATPTSPDAEVAGKGQ